MSTDGGTNDFFENINEKITSIIKNLKESEESKLTRCAMEHRQKNPDRVPLIISPGKHSELPDITRKYSVPKEFTVMNILSKIRKDIKLDQSESLFIFINNKMMTTSKTVGEICKEEGDLQFLRVTYNKEETFGCAPFRKRG